LKAVFIMSDPDEGPWSRLTGSLTTEFLRAFDELGVTVQFVEHGLLTRDPEAGLRQIERACPDFLTALNFNFLVMAAGGDEGLLHLDIPTVALWDDPLGALVNFMCYPSRWGLTPAQPGSRPADPWLSAKWAGLRDWLRGKSRAPRDLRALTASPQLIHFGWDSGHLAAFASLGLAEPRQLHWHPMTSYAPCFRMGETARHVEPTTDVAFCGNVYLSAVRQSYYWQDPFFRGLTERLAARKVRDLGASPWELLLDEVEKTPAGLRRKHGLYTDRRDFWQYYLFAVWSALTTIPRLEVLGGLRREVTLFGLFADPASRELLSEYPNLKFARHLDNLEELPRQYAATKINICVSNGLIYKGTPSKLIDCLASGGFALCDPKEDLVRLFGRKVEAIFCRNADEFNEKIDYYLARPAERREIVEELRRTVVERCNLRNFLGDAVEAVRTGGAAESVSHAGKDAA
jgi:hypothetical protein